MLKEGICLSTKLKIVICLFFVFCFLLPTSFASPKKYDGIWFLGFNLHKNLLQDVRVRQAVAHCINQDYIATKIMSEEVSPASIIPPSMLGYDPDLTPYKTNPKFSKLLMKRANHPLNDPSLKTLSLLHTDGLKTKEIVYNIKLALQKIGMKVKLTEISYRDQAKWIKELESEKHDFFVMGFKAGVEQLFTEEASSLPIIDSYGLIEPLFATNGDANFTSYSNPDIDGALRKISGLDPALKGERHNRLKKINRQLYKDLPVIVLFYIEKL